MDQIADGSPEQIKLVATNPMRIAGLQGVYGDPCGIELVPVTVAEALCSTLEPRGDREPILLIDAGSITPLFAVLQRFRGSCPRAQLIVIGTEADDTYIQCVVAAGAKGFIPATAPPEEFRLTIDNVRDGSIWATRKVLSRLIERRSSDRATDSTAGVQLTPRESEVLRLLLGGKGNREIGEHLGIDPNTVKAHLGRIMRKAGVGNRVELTMYALHRRAEGRAERSRAVRPH